MKFQPDQPMHNRYAVDHNFLTPSAGAEVLTISRLINAFFRWEFNSCESLVVGESVHPIDYANACPDISITSLHYYFPWAISTLLKWSTFCAVSGRKPRLDLDTHNYFTVADSDRTYEEKLTEYRHLADDYFETEHYQDFCETTLSHVDDLVRDWVKSPAFDDLLVETVRSTYPSREHDQFIAHFRRLLGLWAKDNAR